MEHHNGAPSDGVVAAPFSELISAWLDEGDRLDEKAIATAASVPPVTETRARRLLSALRPALDRYRVLVFAAAGLIPFGLFALTHRSVAAPVGAVAAAGVAKVATPSASTLARPERGPTAAQAPTPPTSAAPPAGICEPGEAPALLEPRSPDPRPVPRPHHHHHHLAAKLSGSCGRGPCAVARTAPPSAHAGATAMMPPAVPSARPGQAAIAPAARPSGPVAAVVIARPAAPVAHAAPASPPRRAFFATKGQPLR